MSARNQAKERVRGMLDQLRDLLHESPRARLTESDTKANFIDPLLSALGFSGFRDIRREYYIKNSKDFVDYMLYVADNPVLAVEAKQLQHDLTSYDAAQLIQYASVEGIEWCALTNGRRLQLYNQFLKAPLEGKLVADLDLLAYNSDKEFDALFDDLWLLSKPSWSTPSGIRNWMQQRRFDTAIRELLLFSESQSVQAVRDELRGRDIDAAAETIVQWFRSRLLSPVVSVPSDEGKQVPLLVPNKEPERTSTSGAHSGDTKYWLFPVSARKNGRQNGEHMPADEVLRRWLGRSMWGIWRDTAGRKYLKAGDGACFYLSGTGVVATATVTGPADRTLEPSEWPEDKPAERDVYKVPLAHVQWFEQPVVFTGDLRARLDAFAGRSSDASWSWFVQSTSQLSLTDFRTIGDEAKLTSSPFKAADGRTDTERDSIRRKFWEGLLARARERGVTTHAHRSPSTDSWLSAGSGMGGVEYVYQFLVGEGRIGVELYISTRDRERNKRMFDDLLARREQIEADFGAALEWRRMDDNRASSIRCLEPRSGLRNPESWPDAQATMIDAMDRFSKALGSHIDRIRADPALRNRQAGTAAV